MRKTKSSIEFKRKEAEIIRSIIESEIEISKLRRQVEYEKLLKAMTPEKLSYEQLWHLESGIELEYDMRKKSRKFCSKLVKVITEWNRSKDTSKRRE